MRTPGSAGRGDEPETQCVQTADLTQGNTLTFEREDGTLYFLWVSPPPLVAAILEMARLEPGDVIYDLGSADGRVILRAAQEHDVRAVGIENNPDLCEYSLRRVRDLGLDDRVAVKASDFNAEDLSPADVIVFFLGQEDLAAGLRQKLLQRIAAGARVITVDCPIGELEPTGRRTVRFGSSEYVVTLYEKQLV